MSSAIPTTVLQGAVSAPTRMHWPSAFFPGHSTLAMPSLTTATGGAAFVTGAVLGLVARSIYKKNHDDGCTEVDGDDICDPEQQSQTERARTIGNVGTVVGVVGLAAAGVGVYLWLTAPKDQPERDPRGVTIVPDITPESAGLTAIGRF